MLIDHIYVKLPVELEKDEDGIYSAIVPLLPGCISQGYTRTQALNNIREAGIAYIESCVKHNEPIPPIISD